MMLTIEPNLPIPAPFTGKRTVHRQTNLTAELRALKVGECVTIHTPTVSQIQAAHGYARKAGIKITRRLDRDGVLRLWRIA